MAGMPWAGAKPPGAARSSFLRCALGGPSRPPQHNRAAFVP
jgi:hypothetical protein